MIGPRGGLAFANLTSVSGSGSGWLKSHGTASRGVSNEERRSDFSQGELFSCMLALLSSAPQLQSGSLWLRLGLEPELIIPNVCVGIPDLPPGGTL